MTCRLVVTLVMQLLLPLTLAADRLRLTGTMQDSELPDIRLPAFEQASGCRTVLFAAAEEAGFCASPRPCQALSLGG